MLNLKELDPTALQAHWDGIIVDEEEIVKWKEFYSYFCPPDIKIWKFYGFTPATAHQWMNLGLLHLNTQLAYYLTSNEIFPQTEEELTNLKQGIPAQAWLDCFYPVSGCLDVLRQGTDNLGLQRWEISKLIINNLYLTGHLDVTDFTSLAELYCTENRLTSLQIPIGNKLTLIAASHNDFITFPFTELNPSTLIDLDISDNNLGSTDLAVLQGLEKLRQLNIGNNIGVRIDLGIYNRWSGSLASLQSCREVLRELNIANTDISAGLEYLSFNLFSSWRKFVCSNLPSSSSNNIKPRGLAILLNRYPGFYDSKRYHCWEKENRWLSYNALQIMRLKKIDLNLGLILKQTKITNQLLLAALFNENNGFRLWLSEEIITLERENREYYELQGISQNL